MCIDALSFLPTYKVGRQSLSKVPSCPSQTEKKRMRKNLPFFLKFRCKYHFAFSIKIRKIFFFFAVCFYREREKVLRAFVDDAVCFRIPKNCASSTTLYLCTKKRFAYLGTRRRSGSEFLRRFSRVAPLCKKIKRWKLFKFALTFRCIEHLKLDCSFTLL